MSAHQTLGVVCWVWRRYERFERAVMRTRSGEMQLSGFFEHSPWECPHVLCKGAVG
jgi:hypothetical protein